MNPVTEKVIKRLAYENLLMTQGIDPQRKKINLAEVIQAAKEEPRIYEVLPAIILYKPTIIKGLLKDLPRYPKIKKFVDNLFETKTKETRSFGIDKKDCLQRALTFKKYLDYKRKQQKSRTWTLRLAPKDLELLKKLTHQLQKKSVAETIRSLVQEKASSL